MVLFEVDWLGALIQISKDVPKEFPNRNNIITEFIFNFEAKSKINSSVRVSPQRERLDEAFITNKTAVRKVESIQDLIKQFNSSPEDFMTKENEFFLLSKSTQPTSSTSVTSVSWVSIIELSLEE